MAARNMFWNKRKKGKVGVVEAGDMTPGGNGAPNSKAASDPAENIHLDTPLLKFNGNPWTVRNAVEGVQIFGGIGSGKTTGSGRFLALRYLAAGMGGLVLTVKPDEKERWVKYCDKTGRLNDLIIVDPERENYFNFLTYESTQDTEGGKTSATANIVQVLKTVIRASEDKAAGVGQDPFWETALDMLIFNVIDLCQLAYGRVTVPLMFEVVQSLPTQEKKAEGGAFQTALDTARAAVELDIEAWEATKSADELNALAMDRTAYYLALHNSVPKARLLYFVEQFFTETFATLAERTRSIIVFSFSGFLFRLLRDPVYKLFCQHPSNYWPEKCFEGKIILLNLPVKVHHKAGQDCQIMFKYIWQRAMERRKIEPNSLPVFLWADEGQNFLHEHDADYQATARSSMISTVYLSQNIPNYYANMGGAKSEHRVKSFLGTLATKIFHTNADVETNKYASELIGDGLFIDIGLSQTTAAQFSSTKSKHVKFDRVVRPEYFMGLSTGGERNGYLTAVYIHFQGKVLNNGQNYTLGTFPQERYTPLNS